MVDLDEFLTRCRAALGETEPRRWPHPPAPCRRHDLARRRRYPRREQTRDQLTGAIHIYGGDFVNQPRSQWGPGPIEERPFQIEDARRQLAEANASWKAGRTNPTPP